MSKPTIAIVVGSLTLGLAILGAAIVLSDGERASRGGAGVVGPWPEQSAQRDADPVELAPHRRSPVTTATATDAAAFRPPPGEVAVSQPGTTPDCDGLRRELAQARADLLRSSPPPWIEAYTRESQAAGLDEAACRRLRIILDQWPVVLLGPVEARDLADFKPRVDYLEELVLLLGGRDRIRNDLTMQDLDRLRAQLGEETFKELLGP